MFLQGSPFLAGKGTNSTPLILRISLFERQPLGGRVFCWGGYPCRVDPDYCLQKLYNSSPFFVYKGHSPRSQLPLKELGMYYREIESCTGGNPPYTGHGA